MTFNISNFKSRLDAVGGPARSNLFMVEMFGTNSEYMSDEFIRFFCKTITMPGVNFMVADYNPRNFGMNEKLPMSMAHTELNGLFIMDNDHKILSFFHEWMQNIVNFNIDSGPWTPNPRNDQQLPYEINYHSDYTVRMKIKQFSVGNEDMGTYNQYYECLLDNVYPTEISPTTLSWEGGELMTLSVNFSYSKISFSGTRAGTPSTQTRGYTLVDYYPSIGANGLIEQRDIMDRPIIDNPFSILGFNR